MHSERISATGPSGAGPLAGVRILELGGIGPGPFAGMMLADMGADVIRLDPPGTGLGYRTPLHRGRRSVAVDLKSPRGVDAVRRVAHRCDAVIEGFRPGVAERLGLGPDDLLARNPRLVYGRMTGWGQSGPLAHTAGHDINYIALAGALHAIGPADGDPIPPLNLVADFGGGGMVLAYGIVCALLHSRLTGQGQVVDSAMVDGTAIMLTMAHGMLASGQWEDRRGANLLDGAAPFYRTYRCADGGHVAVGCIEPQFFAEFLRILKLSDDPAFANQYDRASWPQQHNRLEETFATRSRDEWAVLFDGTDACTTAVLSLREAPNHPHNRSRSVFHPGTGEPLPAPRYSATPVPTPSPAPVIGAHTRAVLTDAGLTDDELDALHAEKVIEWPAN